MPKPKKVGGPGALLTFALKECADVLTTAVTEALNRA